MRYIRRNPTRERGALITIHVSLAAAIAFEALAVFSTQDLAVRTVSPWREDPFNTPVSGALFLVPILGAVLAARLAVWDAPGGADRARQMLRAAATIVGVIAVTGGFQWASVILGEDRPAWDDRTAALIGGLLLATGLAAVAATRLLRECRPRQGAWRDDWLGDAALFCARIPILRVLVGPALVGLLRRRATELFVALSLLGSGLVVGALVLGEGWTDPVLIGWAFAVEASFLFAFCVVANDLAGFIARPTRHATARRVEAAIIGATVAVQLAVAFHEEIWKLLAGGPDVPVAGLVAMTGAAALLGISVPSVFLGAVKRR